tara:strand:- start:4675 stop:5460 length:786 start_codon:yes stop_codon:yes gene_type:complete
MAKSVNIHDIDTFGIAASCPGGEYPICPYKRKTIPNFVNDNIDFKYYNKNYKERGIVTIPNFISIEVANSIKYELDNYERWVYASTPHNGKWEVKYEDNLSDESKLSCKSANEKKLFTYRFRRTIRGHYDTCTCVSCRLDDTMNSWPLTDKICKITGHRKIVPGEMFITNYGKDDFLSMHHDKKKGDIAVTISFAYDWYPTYGGQLHFCDKDNRIHTTVSPEVGQINLFKLDPNNGLNHFVSPVVVDKNRYTVVAWYRIVD